MQKMLKNERHTPSNQLPDRNLNYVKYVQSQQQKQ